MCTSMSFSASVAHENIPVKENKKQGIALPPEKAFWRLQAPEAEAVLHPSPRKLQAQCFPERARAGSTSGCRRRRG